jgi:hypothetical protein
MCSVTAIRTPGAARSKAKKHQLAPRELNAGPACFRMSLVRNLGSSKRSQRPDDDSRRRGRVVSQRTDTPVADSRGAPSPRPRRNHAGDKRPQGAIRRVAGRHCSRCRRARKAIRGSAYGPDGQSPQVVLVSPPLIGRLRQFSADFDGALERSRLLGPEFRRVADERRCAFLDAGSLVSGSDADGVHLDRGSHSVIGKAVAIVVRQTLVAPGRAAAICVTLPTSQLRLLPSKAIVRLERGGAALDLVSELRR